MTPESRDFISLREGAYARALSQCQPDVPVTPEDEEPNGVCRGCGNWKYIPAMWHVCESCFLQDDLP